MTSQQRQEFIEVYNKYAAAVYRYCFYHVSSRNLAEDLTQEAFIKAWQYIVSGKEIQNFRSFLYRTSRNLIIDYYRQKVSKYNKTASLEEMADKKIQDGLIYEKNDDYEKNDLLREIFYIMNRLPRIYRDLLVMKYVEDLRPREIAKILNTTNKNISARLKRAERKLNWTLQNFEVQKRSSIDNSIKH